MAELRTNSRHIYIDVNGERRNFPFGPDKFSTEDVQVNVDGAKVLPDTYEWTMSDTNVRFKDGFIPAADSTVELVRITPRREAKSGDELEQLLFVAQELTDEAALGNGRGPPLDWNDAESKPLPVNDFNQPVMQLLPDGDLVADPAGENPGGFRQATFRWQYHVPAGIPTQSMTLAWMSGVIPAAVPAPTGFDKDTSYYTLKLTSKNYQTGIGAHHVENGALHAVATTAAGVAFGNSQGVIAEGRHELAQATRTIGTGNSALTFTAEGGTATRGSAGNGWAIDVVVASPRGADVDEVNKIITVTTGTGAENTAALVADMVNGLIGGVPSEAKDLVHAEAGGDGSGAVVATDGPLNLENGEDVNGKLVGVQAIARPHAIDPGPGWANADGDIVIPGGTYESYAYTANSNGFYPGFAAIIAKGKPEPGEPFDEGWHNAFVAHHKIEARLLWMPLHCAIEAPGFSVKEDGSPTPRTHDSMFMGIGTDRPEGTLHIKTAPAASAFDHVEAPEIILDNAVPLSVHNAHIGRIVMRGPGATEAQTMVLLAGVLTSPLASDDDAKLRLSVAEGGTLTARWNFADGIWAEGVGGDNKGAGSINAASYHVGGTKALYADPATPSALKMRVGNPETETISGDAVDYVATNMTIDTETGMTDDLTTINGGTPGDIVILRAAQNNRTITVRDAIGNINCGTNRVLIGKQPTITLMCTANEGWVCLAYQAN